MAAWSSPMQYLSSGEDERRNHGPTLRQGRRSRKTQGHVSVSRALISVFGTTLQCGFTQKKTQRMQQGAGVPQGRTQPTQNLQPCHHCGHFPNPLSHELPCSPPPDPSALREYDSSLHMPKYHRWPWDWGLCPHPLPKIEPKATCTSMTPTSMARRMSWSNAGAGKHQHQPNLHSIPFIPVPSAIPSEGGPAPWGRGTRSWLLSMYHYHHPKGHREEQHWPHSMPWLIPPSTQGIPLDSREEHRKSGSI